MLCLLEVYESQGRLVTGIYSSGDHNALIILFIVYFPCFYHYNKIMVNKKMYLVSVRKINLIILTKVISE